MDTFLYRVLGCEPDHPDLQHDGQNLHDHESRTDRFGLSNPVTPVLCLLVVVGVEVEVVKDDSVRRAQVDPEPAWV